MVPVPAPCDVTVVHLTLSACPELSKPFCDLRTAWMSSSAFSPYLEQSSSTRSSSSFAPSMQPM
eukprot:3062176-Prymnesium_polylepis.1